VTAIAPVFVSFAADGNGFSITGVISPTPLSTVVSFSSSGMGRSLRPLNPPRRNGSHEKKGPDRIRLVCYRNRTESKIQRAWINPEQLKTNWMDGRFEGYLCPGKGCNGVAKWKEEAKKK